MWVAVAVALLSIGLGGLVSLEVGADFVQHHANITGAVRACGAITGTGLGILIMLLTVYFHLWRVKKRIAIITADGIGLLRDSKLIEDDDCLGVDILTAQFN